MDEGDHHATNFLVLDNFELYLGKYKYLIRKCTFKQSLFILSILLHLNLFSCSLHKIKLCQTYWQIDHQLWLPNELYELVLQPQNMLLYFNNLSNQHPFEFGRNTCGHLCLISKRCQCFHFHLIILTRIDSSLSMSSRI